jgi:hypothetical protein
MQQIPITKLSLSIFLLCVPGIISVILMIPEIANINPQEIPMPLWALQLISGIQTSVLFLIFIFIGSFCARKVWLSAPLIETVLKKGHWQPVLGRQLKPALIGGVIGGIFILVFASFMTPFLPEGFVEAGEKFQPTWYARIFYGGICEEVLVRWGLLSLLVLTGHKLFSSGNSAPSIHIYLAAIFLSAIIFAMSHLPMVHALTPVVDTPLLIYILVGNSVAGLIAGYLFCRYGLESAIFSHMTFHLVFILHSLIT